MKPVDLIWSTYIDSSKKFNDQDLKFKIGAIVRISKYKNIFGKRYVLNLSEEVFMIKKKKEKTMSREYMLLAILKVVYINGWSNSKRQNGKFEIMWF